MRYLTSLKEDKPIDVATVYMKGLHLFWAWGSHNKTRQIGLASALTASCRVFFFVLTGVLPMHLIVNIWGKTHWHIYCVHIFLQLFLNVCARFSQTCGCSVHDKLLRCILVSTSSSMEHSLTCVLWTICYNLHQQVEEQWLLQFTGLYFSCWAWQDQYCYFL